MTFGITSFDPSNQGSTRNGHTVEGVINFSFFFSIHEGLYRLFFGIIFSYLYSLLLARNSEVALWLCSIKRPALSHARPQLNTDDLKSGELLGSPSVDGLLLTSAMILFKVPFLVTKSMSASPFKSCWIAAILVTTFYHIRYMHWQVLLRRNFPPQLPSHIFPPLRTRIRSIPPDHKSRFLDSSEGFIKPSSLYAAF